MQICLGSICEPSWGIGEGGGALQGSLAWVALMTSSCWWREAPYLQGKDTPFLPPPIPEAHSPDGPEEMAVMS